MTLQEYRAAKKVSTLLEILREDFRRAYDRPLGVSTLLEILLVTDSVGLARDSTLKFQPFLRFYRSFGPILWVFKFFGSFLEPRRPLSNPALHSKRTALG
jgi:hypothetical protein